ncbi:uncharacterized protein LOC126741172 [Anthonomus grandis grandis]|uniref:uncharacterized protein LOC126741172 n=1 Tax=Anthonomus grandis grandis TaxID=2921223 RepID=UPI002166418C|nr:uncharacterized protein LOC126741172 [Anthonomus grandis grandis]
MFSVFFKFPILKPVLLSQWIENIGNAETYVMDENLLKNKVVCEKHFDQIYIAVSNKRKRLLKSAVPIPWKESASKNTISLPDTSCNAQSLESLDAKVSSINWENDTTIDTNVLPGTHIQVDILQHSLKNDKQLKTYSRKRLHEDEIVGDQHEKVKLVRHSPSPQSTQTVLKFTVDYPDTPSSTKSNIKKKSRVLSVQLTLNVN